jgi:hypothetical protein
VWLFQRAQYFFSWENQSEYEWSDEEEEYVDGDGKVPDLQTLLDQDIAFKYWHTSAVFLTRVEGVNFGFSRHYDHGKYGEDWRLYGVPACGEMAEKLGAIGVNQPYIDSKVREADRAVDEWRQKLSGKFNGEKNG